MGIEKRSEGLIEMGRPSRREGRDGAVASSRTIRPHLGDQRRGRLTRARKPWRTEMEANRWRNAFSQPLYVSRSWEARFGEQLLLATPWWSKSTRTSTS